MKTKRCIATIFILICILALSSCSSPKIIEWNGELEYYHITMIYDETNMYETAGQVDYIFIGTVDEVLRNVVDYNTSDSMDTYSYYSITVNENLKGTLVDNIKCYRHGGYLKDGTLLYPRSDRTENTNDIPKEGKTYIFMAFGQPDGELILAEFSGDVEYTDNNQREMYMDYIENEIPKEQVGFVSKYDVSYKN